MRDGSKTKKQLIDELISLRQQLAELMGSEAVRNKLIQDLQLSEDRMKYLITLSPVTIFMCRPSGDYGATYISSNITDQMGYESHEFTDDSRFWADHIHPEDRERVFEDLGALFERGYHIHVYRFLHKDGSYRWMYDDRRLVRDEKGNPVEIIGFWMDITDIKFAGRKLAESEERHRDLIDNISDGVYPLNRDGYFTYVNRAILERSELSENDFYRIKFSDIVVEEDKALAQANNEQLKLEIKERKSAEVSLKKKTNELKLQADKLSELNIALKVLLKQREDDKNDLGETVTLNVKELLLPSLEVLKNSRLDAKQKDFVCILESNLNEIISPFAHNLSSKYYGLTPREIEIANLIRQGKSTKEITNFICISNGSIIVHRNHIRKKLGIISKKINLRSHLMSLS